MSNVVDASHSRSIVGELFVVAFVNVSNLKKHTGKPTKIVVVVFVDPRGACDTKSIDLHHTRSTQIVHVWG